VTIAPDIGDFWTIYYRIGTEAVTIAPDKFELHNGIEVN
jgi:hypothetical protein